MKALQAEDLKGYLALNLFEQRQLYKHMRKSLQRVIKTFYGSMTSAQSALRSGQDSVDIGRGEPDALR